MKLFIKFSNGDFLDHPVLLENLQAAFPNFDPEHPPEPWVPFERIVQPNPTDTVSYVFDRYIMGSDGVVRDSWREVPIEPLVEPTVDTQKNTP